MDQPVSTRPATILMTLTYVAGFVGAFIGFATLAQDPPSLAIAALVAVTLPGVLSFLRHAVFNRSDAARGGWDFGTRNNFQIEVGLANLAWGIYALLAVVLDWGLQAIAASFLISGFYFAAVTIFVLASGDIRQRRIGGLIGIASWATVTIWLGILGMTAG